MRRPFDLGSTIFNHIMSYVKPREKNVKFPFPNLIFGILSTQGLELYDYEVKMRALDSYKVDHKLLEGKRAKDITPVIPTKILVLLDYEQEDVTPLGKNKKLVASLRASVHNQIVERRLIGQ